MSGAPHLSDIDALAAAVRGGERQSLAIALNLLDDRRPDARERATALLASLQRNQDDAAQNHLIGITGPPGAGKSTLTAALIQVWRQRELRVGVLAVDPSSPISGGALLGDRLRMKAADDDDGLFIRSLACRGEFGGLSAEVLPMSQIMLSAFDITVVETVGVGQREIDVSAMCDTTCFVAQPGSGDSIQFLKAGILEVPDILVVNKEDMGAVARRTLSELAAAVGREQLEGEWPVPVLSASASQGSGIDALADTLERHRQFLLQRESMQFHRSHYQASWIVKRLGEEFGTHGVARLGGEAALLAALVVENRSLYEQYETLRQTLLQGWKAL